MIIVSLDYVGFRSAWQRACRQMVGWRQAHLLQARCWVSDTADSHMRTNHSWAGDQACTKHNSAWRQHWCSHSVQIGNLQMTLNSYSVISALQKSNIFVDSIFTVRVCEIKIIASSHLEGIWVGSWETAYWKKWGQSQHGEGGRGQFLLH